MQLNHFGYLIEQHSFRFPQVGHVAISRTRGLAGRSSCTVQYGIAPNQHLFILFFFSVNLTRRQAIYIPSI